MKVVKNPPADTYGPVREGGSYAARPSRTRRQNPIPTDGEVHVLHVQGNVYMLVGAGGNITVQVGDMGVLMVDTGLAQTRRTR